MPSQHCTTQPQAPGLEPLHDALWACAGDATLVVALAFAVVAAGLAWYALLLAARVRVLTRP